MKITLVLCASLLFFSCKKEVAEVEIKTDSIVNESIQTPIDLHNSHNALDWQGTYKGLTPCADCEGIETEITLNKDLTFVIRTKYIGKGDGKIGEEKGSFTWDSIGGCISLEGLKGRPSQYKVGENQLIQLDMNGNAITGSLSKMYILTK